MRFINTTNQEKFVEKSLPCELILFVHVSIVDYEGILKEVHQDMDEIATLEFGLKPINENRFVLLKKII